MAARGVVEVYDAGVLAPPGVVALNADFGHYLELLLRGRGLPPADQGLADDELGGQVADRDRPLPEQALETLEVDPRLGEHGLSALDVGLA